MKVDYKKMLKTVPENIKDRVDRFANIAYVKYVNGTYVEAYSPIFKDITVNANHGTMGCKRGDTISIKLSPHGVNHFELIENITLNQEIKLFENSKFDFDWTEPETTQFLKWRAAQFNDKQH